jgi:hypothetical protein
VSDPLAKIPGDPSRDPDRLLAPHDELDALTKKRSSVGSTLSGTVAAAFALKDARRSLRKRELRKELTDRSARGLSSG